MASTSAALEGLPKQFVTSMKTLFEIMDDKNTGYVKFSGVYIRFHSIQHDLLSFALPCLYPLTSVWTRMHVFSVILCFFLHVTFRFRSILE